MESIISNYRLEKLLGEGGMGKVYLARHIHQGSLAAIKELNAEMASDPHLRLRFQREAEAMALLRHPNIVRFIDFKIIEGIFYLVMEYALGMTLSNYIATSTGPIPEERANRLMSKILDAFEYAHRKGVIHRDIKPNNIIISPDGDVKILDFGIAKVMTSSNKLTTIGTILGTPMYMSPEQVLGRELDCKSDIYTLGVLYHQMVTGTPPYNESFLSKYELDHQITQEPLPRAKDLYPGVSDKAQTIIDRATQKNKESRYDDCQEFLQEINGSNGQGSQKLVKQSIIIGRDSSCDLTISDRTGNISRRHARLYWNNGQLILEDNSTNGTLVNRNMVHKSRIVVVPGDQVLLASTVLLPWNEVMPLISSESNERSYDTPETVLQEHSENKKYQTPKEIFISEEKSKNSEGDKLEVLAGILCAIIPLVGFVLYFVWKKDYPQKAKTARLISLISFVVYFIMNMSDI